MDNVTDWLNEVDEAKKREKDYRKSGDRILDIYEEGEKTPFNILYSNTETLLPALYSQTPRPVIKKRYTDDDKLGQLAANAGQRMLEYLLDTDNDGYDKFDTAMEDAVLDGLLPGRGVTAIKYDSSITDDSVDNEVICADSRVWNRVFFGYAKKWSKVPWMAYEEYLSKEECIKLFGKEIVSQLKFTADSEDNDDHEENNHKGDQKTICIYQIWDKSDRTVKYITPQYKDDFLRVDPDPLELTGFFNCPKPLRFVRKSNNLKPTALYTLYENQAKELNRIQVRLNRVIEAIKVRGCYDGQLGDDLQKILNEDDNALIPTDKSSMLIDKGGFDNSIWMLPIEKLVIVAQQLYQARESCKRVIYEITGISDIVRGQSAASETLGAQKIKEAWGTMRLKRLQKDVQQYALDLIKMMLEVAVNQYDEQTWAKITNLTYPTIEDKEKAQLVLEQAKSTGMQPDPRVMKVMELPTWTDILKLLKDDALRSYRIDIETNSTLDVEATEDKQLIADFMNSMAQFMNGINPLIEKGYMDFNIAKSMMLEIVRRHRFGRDVEDQISSMHPPKNQNTEEVQKKLQEAQKKLIEEQKKLQQDKAKYEDELKKASEKLDEEHRKLQFEKLEFDYAKKLAQLESQKNDEINQVVQESRNEEVKSDIKEMILNAKRDIQSMLDKQKAKIDASVRVQMPKGA